MKTNIAIRAKAACLAFPGSSNDPQFMRFTDEQEIDSISLNPDTVLKATLAILEKE